MAAGGGRKHAPRWGHATATALLVSAQSMVPARVDARPPHCTLSAQLMAVVYNERQPTRSFAMVVRSGKEGRMIRRGSYVEGRRVLAVLPRALLLGPPEAPCVLRLQHAGTQTATPRSTEPKKARKRRGGK